MFTWSEFKCNNVEIFENKFQLFGTIGLISMIQKILKWFPNTEKTT